MAYRAPAGRGYADVAAHFREQIKHGDLAPGDSLPSVGEIREQFDVAAKTVSRALGVLKAEGLVTSRGALGTVVSKSAMVITGADRLDRMARNGLKYGHGETSSDHRVMRRSLQDPKVCQALEVEPGEEVIIRIRTFRQDDRPTSVGLSVYPLRAVSQVPELADEGRMARPWPDLFTERTGQELIRGQRIAKARQASTDELEALGIDAPQHVSVAVLVTAQSFHDEDGPIAFWEDVYAPGTEMPLD